MIVAAPGAPIVFIHGLFQLAPHLPMPEYFAPRPVFMPDLMGYHAEPAPASWSLHDQADSVASRMRARGYGRSHIVGHSIGGAVAVLLAHRHPELVASVVSVEGNFTLKDAFWSQKIAKMSLDQVREMLVENAGDAAAWLKRSGVEPEPEIVASAAREFLELDPSTIFQMAVGVVEATRKPEYLEFVRSILDSGVPFSLIAGEKSRGGWDVPDFVLERAAGVTLQANAGHLMTLEDPQAFLELLAKIVAKAERTQ